MIIFILQSICRNMNIEKLKQLQEQVRIGGKVGFMYMPFIEENLPLSSWWSYMGRFIDYSTMAQSILSKFRKLNMMRKCENHL